MIEIVDGAGGRSLYFTSFNTDLTERGICVLVHDDGSYEVSDDDTGSYDTWQLSRDDIFDELYETWHERVKEKEYSIEAYEFERDIGRKLGRLADHVYDLSWKPKGYFDFDVYHPHRIISAPYYEDRIVEDWHAERFIKPYASGLLYPGNVACQEDKGPPDAKKRILAAMESLYKDFGTDFWVLRGDMQGYFDNLSHDRIKEVFSGMPEAGRRLLFNIIDDWETVGGYASISDPDHKYGVPKGNLPSQWIGILYLNDLDWLISEREDCRGNVRYMDDFIAFFHTKASCMDCKIKIEKYLEANHMGIRLHPKKTCYLPARNGFTFCGWRYQIFEDGHIRMRVRPDRKGLTKKKFEKIREDYFTGKLSYADVVQKLNGVYAYLKQGGNGTKQFRRYLSYRYTFTHDEELFYKRN